MKKKTIHQLYEDLLQLPFPKAIANEAYADWIADLAEFDCFYAGLAVSLITGEIVKTQKLPSLNPLVERLEKSHLKEGMNEHLYNQCKEYLSALQAIANTIEEDFKRT